MDGRSLTKMRFIAKLQPMTKNYKKWSPHLKCKRTVMMMCKMLMENFHPACFHLHDDLWVFYNCGMYGQHNSQDAN